MLEDFDQARAQASEAMTLCQELEDPRGIAWSLDVFAGLMADEGHADGAARLWGASDEMLQGVGGSLPPNIKVIRERYIGPVKAALDGSRYDAACAEGRSMPRGPGNCARSSGDGPRQVYLAVINRCDSAAGVSAITAHAVPAAEMNWSRPYGNPLSKCGCSQIARVSTCHVPSGACVRSR